MNNGGIDGIKGYFEMGYWNYNSEVPGIELERFGVHLREWLQKPYHERGPLFVPKGIEFISCSEYNKNNKEVLDIIRRVLQVTDDKTE